MTISHFLPTNDNFGHLLINMQTVWIQIRPNKSLICIQIICNLMVFLKELFENIDFENNRQMTKKKCKNYRANKPSCEIFIFVGPDLGLNCLQRLSADDKKSLLARKLLVSVNMACLAPFLG